MINIIPITDLKNKYSEIEKTVNKGEVVYLTKDGYGSMALISLQDYAGIIDELSIKKELEAKLEDNKKLSQNTTFILNDED